VKSGGGVFEITIDGKLAFSKKKTGRFPEEHEVKALIA
jgi:selT/selW/selH-like putative selenoprotein